MPDIDCGSGYRLLGPDEKVDMKQGDELWNPETRFWEITSWRGQHAVKHLDCVYRRPIKRDNDTVAAKETSPQVYNWFCGGCAIYGVPEATALVWFDEQLRRVAEKAEEGASTVILFRSHATATINTTVEISVKLVDGAV